MANSRQNYKIFAFFVPCHETFQNILNRILQKNMPSHAPDIFTREVENIDLPRVIGPILQTTRMIKGKHQNTHTFSIINSYHNILSSASSQGHPIGVPPTPL